MIPDRDQTRAFITKAVADELSLLTVQQVAELLNVKPEWLYDAVQAGQFPVVRLGRMLRFRVQDVQAHIEANYHPADGRASKTAISHGASRRRGRPRMT